MELQDIIIKPEFRDFLPSLKDRTALAEKIAAEGWTDEPITVWQHHGILLDGHNRYAIWQERVANGIDDDGPLIRELKFDSEEAAFYWVVNNQCARRNLTPEEQRYLLGRRYTAEKSVKGAPEGNKNNSKSQMVENLPIDSVKPTRNPTAKRIGEQAGVSDFTVKNAEVYANAVDDLDKRGIVAKSDVLSGKVKAPATRIVAASKAVTEEEAKEILRPTKPKARKEDAPIERRGEENIRKEKQAQYSVADLPENTRIVNDLRTLKGEQFSVVYADPPWQYANQGTRAATDNHYVTMPTADICDMPVRDIVADNAQLHLWTTNGFIREAFDVIEAWGFEYRSMFIWCKPQFGIGNYWRVSHEIMLCAVRGSATFRDKSLRSWAELERGRHSAKPEAVRDMVMKAFHGPYLEIFGRQAVEGWTVFGNEVEPTLFAKGDK